MKKLLEIRNDISDTEAASDCQNSIVLTDKLTDTVRTTDKCRERSEFFERCTCSQLRRETPADLHKEF
jgi:hypothetical protein